MTFREWVGKQTWIYAKTYAAFAPHEYALRNRTPNKEDFDLAVKCIQENGMRMFYYKAERKYLYLDGWFYWALWSKDDLSDAIINRCRPEDYDIVFMRRGTQARAAKAEEEKAQEKKRKQKTRFHYGMLKNGFSFGNQPMNGLIEVIGEQAPYLNILVYNRELSQKEIKDYDLKEIE